MVAGAVSLRPTRRERDTLAVVNRWKLAIIAVAVVMTLAGCLRFDANLALSPDDTVTGRFIVAVKAGTGKSYNTTDRAMAESIWSDYPASKSLTKAKISDYSGDGYVGISVTFAHEPLATFAPTATGWGITRVGDEFMVSGPSNATATQSATSGSTGAFTGDLSQLSDTELSVSISFPGPVTASNGTVKGRTVSWNLTDGPKTLEARGSAIATTDPDVRIAYIVFAILVLGAIAYALAGRAARRRR